MSTQIRSCALLVMVLAASYLSFEDVYAAGKAIPSLSSIPSIPGIGATKPSPAKSNDASTGSTAFDAIKTVTAKESPEEEVESGNIVAASILGAAPLWNNAKAQHYINLVGRHVAQHSERPELIWRFAVLDTPSINAFAFPGGIVFVTRGLYDLLETEDELAAILSHEVVHINRKHQWEVIKQQKLVALGASAALKGDHDAIMAKVASIGTEMISKGLDKSAEYQADREGMVIAGRSGYDASAMLGVMQKLRAQKGDDKSLGLLFATHPAPSDRINALEASATPAIEALVLPSPAAGRLAKYH